MKADYDYDQLFPGRFIKSGELNGKDVTLTIKDIDLEEMEDRKGLKVKCIVSFVETKKQLVANRTNAECFKGLWGRRVKDWIGKRVTFYPCTVEAFGAPTLAIRVRGSPDLAADTSITIKAGRAGDVRVTMKKTVARGKTAAAPAAKPPETAKATPPPPITAPVTTHGPPPEDEAPPAKRAAPAAKAAKRIVIEEKSDPVTGEVFEEEDDSDPFPDSEDALAQ